jgi:hypothetical protein
MFLWFQEGFKRALLVLLSCCLLLVADSPCRPVHLHRPCQPCPGDLQQQQQQQQQQQLA